MPEWIEIHDESTGTWAEIEGPAKPVYVAYTAGPMTGLPNYNFDQFNEVELAIISRGLPRVDRPLDIVNPARNFGGDQTRPRREYLSLAVRQVTAADGLVLLPDWWQSEGAQLEATLALDLGKDFYVAFKRDGRWEVGATSAEVVRAVLMALADKEPPAEPIEEVAGELVRRGARRQTYGHPRGDFDSIACIWTGILRHKVTAEQVALCMSGLKLARLSETHQHRDSKVDGIGYIVALDELDGTEASEWAA